MQKSTADKYLIMSLGRGKPHVWYKLSSNMACTVNRSGIAIGVFWIGDFGVHFQRFDDGGSPIGAGDTVHVTL